MPHSSPHQFHIPVMGLAYTIDTPIKVARFGISSVMSIVEDRLIEMMRKHYSEQAGWTYLPITTQQEDYRAKRITDYLNLVNSIVEQQVTRMKEEAFVPGTEIVKYFEMLPETSALKHTYHQMLAATDDAEKQQLQTRLRKGIRAGAIDVNIMTKVDRERTDADGQLITDGSDAVAALRGYANSRLQNSSVIFSAGMNPRLYNYLEQCSAFDADEDGRFKKKVVVKVSDYRSALIQGKYLAKKGIWVSEFRIESGLNCGGHAFATEGYLLGPILEEFKNNRQQLTDALFEVYNAAILKKSGQHFKYAPKLVVTVQGGIGTHEEDQFLHREYNIAGTGWGTPFLLVPEATTVDAHTLQLLSDASEKDIALSRNSPLGVRFYYLKATTSDQEKQARIAMGVPGSACTEKHLAFNTEFTTEPICTASRRYQKMKLTALKEQNLPEAEYQRQVEEVVAKECLCVGLSNAAALCYEEEFVKRQEAVNICPGPNIVNFSKVVSLQAMTDHIYGRQSIAMNPDRPHVFLAEIKLYLDYLEEQLQEDARHDLLQKKKKYYTSFCQNLQHGFEYYQQIAGRATAAPQLFLDALQLQGARLAAIQAHYLAAEEQLHETVVVG